VFFSESDGQDPPVPPWRSRGGRCDSLMANNVGFGLAHGRESRLAGSGARVSNAVRELCDGC